MGDVGRRVAIILPRLPYALSYRIDDILSGIKTGRTVGVGLQQFLALCLTLSLQRLMFLLVWAYRPHIPRIPPNFHLGGVSRR